MTKYTYHTRTFMYMTMTFRTAFELPIRYLVSNHSRKQFFDSILYIPGLLEILKEIPVNCTNFKGKHYKKYIAI